MQNIQLGGRLRAPAQRRHLRRLPPDPRHRRLPFPRRRLDHREAVTPWCRPRRISSATRSRRRDILTSVPPTAERPDFSRGFSNRPQLRGGPELAGTEYQRWLGRALLSSQNPGIDRSFRAWTSAVLRQWGPVLKVFPVKAQLRPPEPNRSPAISNWCFTKRSRLSRPQPI